MAELRNSRASEYLRDAIERHLGAPLCEAVREHNRLGYILKAQNGMSMFLGERDCYELMGGTQYPVYRFAPKYNPQAYSIGYDTGITSATAAMQSQMMMMYQNQYYMNGMQVYTVPVAPTPPKASATRSTGPNAKNLRKLFWHRYSKTGKQPL